MRRSKFERAIAISTLSIMACLVGIGQLNGAVINLNSSGNWHDPNIWADDSTGQAGLPVTGDRAVTNGGHTVNFTAASGDQTVGTIWARSSTINISGDDTLAAC